jgi:hypothetical protein
MRRRDLVTLLGLSAAAWPLAARAQHPTAKMPRIGIIDDAPIWTDVPAMVLARADEVFK